MRKFLILSMLLTAVSKLVFGQDTSIRDLTSVEQLREAFQEDAGKIRIVALLSPT